MKYIFLFFLTMSILDGKTQCYSAGQNLPGGGFIVRTSGYNELDKIVISEINQLQLFFGVKVDFFFLLESYSENAMYNQNCRNKVIECSAAKEEWRGMCQSYFST